MLRCDRCGRRCEGVQRHILALGVTACLCPDCSRKGTISYLIHDLMEGEP